MNPVPFEILRVEAGASDATVERVRDLSRQAGLCPYSK
jgi:hypothetical protein